MPIYLLIHVHIHVYRSKKIIHRAYKDYCRVLYRMQDFNIIIFITKKIYIPLPSHTYVPGELKPNSVQMFLLILIYLVTFQPFENRGKMGEVVNILGRAHFKENPRSTNTQRFVFNKQNKNI